MASSENGTESGSTRRTFIKTAAVAAGAAPFITASRLSDAKTPRPPATTPFIVPLPVHRPKQPSDDLDPLPGSRSGEGECGRDEHQHWDRWLPTKFYEIDVREDNHEFHPELPKQKIWGYDGLTPGPTIVARYGEPTILRIRNNLSDSIRGYGSPEISTHLHNAHCASASDGFAGNYFSSHKFGPTLTRPGDYYDYHYPNAYAGSDKYPETDGDPREALGTLWYHDHRMDFTAGNVYRGLAGFYLMFDKLDSGNENDPDPQALRLPSGVGIHDLPIMIQDKQFDSSGYLRFNQFETDGFIGNKFCVNGVVQPFCRVKRRKYRLRLLNASTSRFYDLYLVAAGTDQFFHYIANDGNLLPAPLWMKKIFLAPAERADIVVDFSRYALGTRLFLVNRLAQFDGRGPSSIPLNPGVQLMRFDVDQEPDAPDHSRVPATLRQMPIYSTTEAVTRRSFEFDRENDFWTVNGRVFDVFKPMFTVKRGSAEIWTLKGKGSWWHPIHIHLEEVIILSRNGMPPPPHERGRKDVISLKPDDIVRIFIRFRDFSGKYMMHCHNTIHEDHAMMVRFDVV